jgi:hypothetical protein
MNTVVEEINNSLFYFTTQIEFIMDFMAIPGIDVNRSFMT